MQPLRPLVACALSLALCACSSEPPPRELRRPPVTRPAPVQVAQCPSGVLAPVDTWRQRLEDLVPAPWKLEAIEAQVEAPPGWTRLDGDRGLVLYLTDGTQRQAFWVMPADFEGRIVDAEQAAAPSARCEGFVLFAPKAAAPGWTASAEVAAALDMTSL